jgi:hypothetical protein
MSRRIRSGDPRLRAQSTGLQIEAAHKAHARFASPPPGIHQWIVMASWAVKNPRATQYQLDVENLLTIEGPGCFVCEEPFNEQMAALPCPGEPPMSPR